MEQLGDARNGKMAGNIAGFGRALRRAGVPTDASRIALATEAAVRRSAATSRPRSTSRAT